MLHRLGYPSMESDEPILFAMAFMAWSFARIAD
jgi:hypothetical protein